MQPWTVFVSAINFLKVEEKGEEIKQESITVATEQWKIVFLIVFILEALA